MRKALLLLILTLPCSMNLGCTFGPQVKTTYVLVKAGLPCRILENRTLRVKTLKGDASVKQDVGGWVAMPEDHWAAIKRALEKDEPND